MSSFIVVPHEGELQLMTDLFTGGTLESWLLCLYNAAVNGTNTPSEYDSASTYTTIETAFTNYSRKTLTRSIGVSSWSTLVSQAPSGGWSARALVGHTQYYAAQSWTCGVTGDTIYGYFILGATSSKLILAEAFSPQRTIAQGDTLSFTPIFENA